MQVGNALTNAAALLSAGVCKGDNLESVAEMVLCVGERLKMKLQRGDFAFAEPAAPKEAAVALVVDSEIPFGS